MQRREFLQTAAAASAGAALAPLTSSAAERKAPAGREYYELRAYRFKPGASTAPLDAYLEKAFIPTVNAQSVPNVGVFTEPDAKDGLVVWVLIPYTSLQTMLRVTAALNADATVQKAGAEYLKVGKDQAVFDRIDSWLHLAFMGMQKLQAPAGAESGQPRIFEMRTYESFSEVTALKKVDMFNNGEIDVMREVGLAPVFYGQALLGSNLPHLTYMLSGTDRASYDKNWKAFQVHPTWVKMKADPQYADTVSKITSRFLVPTRYSQI